MAEEATNTEVIETLAFELCAAAANKGQPNLIPRSDLMHNWRGMPDEERAEWRLAAQDMRVQLQTHGMEVRPRKAVLIREHLDEIMTIPARKAYDLSAMQ